MKEAQFPGYIEYQNRDYAAAFPKLVAVAQSGNAEAQCMLGSLYQLGAGAAQDSAQAAEWYERSSAQGNGLASSNLAGILITQGNSEEAQRLYALSRQQGFMHSPAPAVATT